jgi:histidyl-tRNA synthetase
VRAELKQAGLVLAYNNVGCNRPGCRDSYRQSLKELLAGYRDRLCPDCQKRIDRNVFRVLDCKRADCRKVCDEVMTGLSGEQGAHFCGTCRSQIDFLEGNLASMLPGGISKRRSWDLVRGLDYYTGTVFEFATLGLGAQDAVGGGGRYDNLIADLGGPSLGATGFALGLERILLAQEAADAGSPEATACRGLTYVFPVLGQLSASFFGYGTQRNYDLAMHAYGLALELRRKGLRVEFDLDRLARKPGNHLKRATRLGAALAVIVGHEEMAAGAANLKIMSTREERRVKRAALGDEIRRVLC